MPYKSDKLKLQGMQDRRRKLSNEQKEAIKQTYEKGNTSHRKLAAEYNVSRSLIQIIVNPERENTVKNRFKENWKIYADREKLTKATRELRKYKQELYKKGELN